MCTFYGYVDFPPKNIELDPGKKCNSMHFYSGVSPTEFNRGIYGTGFQMWWFKIVTRCSSQTPRCVPHLPACVCFDLKQQSSSSCYSACFIIHQFLFSHSCSYLVNILVYPLSRFPWDPASLIHLVSPFSNVVWYIQQWAMFASQAAPCDISPFLFLPAAMNTVSFKFNKSFEWFQSVMGVSGSYRPPFCDLNWSQERPYICRDIPENAPEFP